MTTSTNDARSRPPWAERVLAALADAGAYGFTSPKGSAEVRLTQGERELLDAIEYRLRGRLGEQIRGVDDLGGLGDAVLRRAMELIAAEQRAEVAR